MERSKRPRGRVWRMVRKTVQQRDGNRCQICGARRGLEVHHIVPLSEGGSSYPSNLVTLCRGCHCIVHAAYAPTKRAHVEGGMIC